MFATRLLFIVLVTSLWSTQASAFAREFNQDNHPSVFHAETSSELCLFVRSRQGILMIQPHCMVSASSNSASVRLDQDDRTEASARP